MIADQNNKDNKKTSGIAQVWAYIKIQLENGLQQIFLNFTASYLPISVYPGSGDPMSWCEGGAFGESEM